MNCFDFRKNTLAVAGMTTPDHAEHAAGCAACAAFAHDLILQDEKLREALQVQAPEGLVGRILLAQRRNPQQIHWRPWAIAASVIAAVALSSYTGLRESHYPAERIVDASALSGNHLAIAAIDYVVEHEPQLLAENVQGDPEVMRANLQRIGLQLPAGTEVRYLGKCPVIGGTADHLVVQTSAGPVTLMLVADQGLGARVMVAYRDKTAVATSIRRGGYIMIADSASAVQRLEQKLL